MMIPDIYFGVLLLNVMLIVRKDIGIMTRGFLMLSTVILLTFHNALPILLAGFAVVFSAILVLRKGFHSYWRPMVSLTLLSIIGGSLIGLSNYAYRGELVYSPGYHAFFLNRLRDAGMLKEYLNESCPEAGYELCNYQDQLAGDFLWDVENSPFYKMGAWEGTRGEYAAIIREIMSSPYYLKKLAINGVFTGISQLFAYDQGTARSQNSEGPDYAIRERFVYDQGQFSGARQQLKGLDLSVFNPVNLAALALFFIYSLIVLARNKERQGVISKVEVLLVLCFLVINAGQSALLSGVVDRYGTRMLWVLMMILIAEMFTWLLRKKPWQQWLNL